MLADGGTVHVRPITVADADELVAFHDARPPRRIYYRYFSAKSGLTETSSSASRTSTWRTAPGSWSRTATS